MKKEPIRCRAAAILLILVFLGGCRLPQNRETWTVVSWNVQNLFDGNDDGSEYSEFDPGNDSWDDRLYRRRLERCGEVILDCVDGGPDLLVFQEIENSGVLDDLADGPLKGRGYRWRVASPGPGSIRCGILSRYPLNSVSVSECGYYGDRPLRPLLSVQVDTPGGAVRLLAVHWKSPRDGREATESARLVEADVALGEAELYFDSSDPEGVLLVGDFNTPADGSLLPSAIVPWEPGIAAERGVMFSCSEAEAAGVRGDISVFFDPEPDTDQGPPGTYFFRDSWDRPDRALLSPGITAGEGLRFSSCIAGGQGLMTDAAGRPLRWITDTESGYSDHLPLILEFAVRPAEENPEG